MEHAVTPNSAMMNCCAKRVQPTFWHLGIDSSARGGELGGAGVVGAACRSSAAGWLAPAAGVKAMCGWVGGGEDGGVSAT
jgi:hypothetical protein